VKAYCSGKKNVVANILLENFATFNFHQTNIKRCFHIVYIQNKVVQLPNNAIVEKNYIF
jgi:hypothetical protein